MAFKKCFPNLLFFLFIVLSLHAQEHLVRTDYANSFINFGINELEIDGTISGIDTYILIDDENLEESVVQGSATVNTLTTGNMLRNKKLLGKKFFNEKDFPLITFESTDIQKMQDNVYMVAGDLTIRDITNRIYIEMYFQIDRILGVSYFNTNDFDIVIKEKENYKVDFFLELLHPGAE